MNFPEAKELARTIDAALLATDPRFNRWVHVLMKEGTTFFIKGGFSQRHEDFVFVFAEHYPYMVFHESDVERIREFARVS